MGTYVVCVFRPGRGRRPHDNRVAHGPWAVVYLHGGFRRNPSKNGAVWRQLGSVPGVLWSGPHSIRFSYHLRGMSRNLGRGRRAYTAARSACRPRYDAARRSDFPRRRGDYRRRDSLRTCRKEQRDCSSTAKRHSPEGVSWRISPGFYFRHSGLNAQSWIGFWREHSTRRTTARRESCHDVECSVAAVSVRRLLARSNLLLHPDARERHCRHAPLAGYLVLLVGRGEHGVSVVWQHHSVQYLDLETGRAWHIDRVAGLSRLHCGGEYHFRSVDGRMGSHRYAADQDNDGGGWFARSRDSNSELRRPGLAASLPARVEYNGLLTLSTLRFPQPWRCFRIFFRIMSTKVLTIRFRV